MVAVLTAEEVEVVVAASTLEGEDAAEGTVDSTAEVAMMMTLVVVMVGEAMR